MNEYLSKNYALLNKEVKSNDSLTRTLRKIIKTPAIQYILFGILMCIVGILATKKILPYPYAAY